MNETDAISRLSPQKRALLALLLRNEAKEAAAIPTVPREPGRGYPLSASQQRLWFLHQLEPTTPFYNLAAAVHLDGPLRVDALRRALESLALRHESLRTRFRATDGQPMQFIEAEPGLPMPEVDLSAEFRAHGEAAWHGIAAEQARRPFTLDESLVRALLVKLGDQQHLLLLTMHHIVTDGWSNGVLLRDLAALYAAACSGDAPALPALALQYVDYAAWQQTHERSERVAEGVAFWKERLTGVPSLGLPTDRPRPPVQSFRGARRRFALDASLAGALQRLAQQEGATLFSVLLAAFDVLMYRHSGQSDFAVGTPVAGRTHMEFEDVVGCFFNTVAVRVPVTPSATFRSFLRRVQDAAVSAQAHQDVPFEVVIDAVQPARDLSRNPLFQVLFSLQNAPMPPRRLGEVTLTPVAVDAGTSQFDLAVNVWEEGNGLAGWFEYATDLFSGDSIDRMAGHFLRLLQGIAADPDVRVDTVPLLTADERDLLLAGARGVRTPVDRAALVHALMEAQAQRTPERVALRYHERTLTYAELDARAERLGACLRARGVEPETRVGVLLDRSLDTVVALYGVLKAGGAYVPLDPAYPADRVMFMMQDAGIAVVVTDERLAHRLPDSTSAVLVDDAVSMPTGQHAALRAVQPDNAAYVIYTSGSTGRPKGVIVEHRNAVNFFAAMDAVLSTPASAASHPGVWLAVTSISFDISVLELLWTLARGFEVVLGRPESAAAMRATPRSTRPIAFSLFYFADDASGSYDLLLEGARFADANGFSAVWTPERHFHRFGGRYPNPAVTGAAVAAITRRIGIRAGSVVLPLHDPIRVAEEWAVVDQLSGGRASVSFASGWHANDFVLAPDRYADRKAVMLRGIDTVRSLWRGEAVRVKNGVGHEVDIRVLPRPVQAEIPIWLTAAGSPDTFEAAGRIGAGVLTHLLGQSMQTLAQNIARYRRARKDAGLAGEGTVALMLHAFAGEDDDEVRETVREPFTNYLRSSVGLLRDLAVELGQDLDADSFGEADQAALLTHAFERFFRTSGLFGTRETCRNMVERLREIGVDDIALLIDFGVDHASVMKSLRVLDDVRRSVEEADRVEDPASLIRNHGVTHLQCTPSMASMMIASAPDVFAPLGKLLLGGEALPPSLVRTLAPHLRGQLHNMYGPTETTVWSSTERVDMSADGVTIGLPVANTEIYVLDQRQEPVPIGALGELYIGGLGVVRGYHGRPDLTAERFVPDPFSGRVGARLYRTGDVARRLPDGRLEYLGRTDQQVKIRGHRIELGEVEDVLARHPAAHEAIAIARTDGHGSNILVGFVIPRAGMTSPTTDELRRWTREHLPEPMVPSVFVIAAELPRTPNGKVDRRALAVLVPTEQNAQEKPRVAPRNPVEEQLAVIWHDLLRREVSVYDDFFEVGGHSLLATQLAARVRDVFQLELPLRRFFELPTVAGLAEVIASEGVMDEMLQELENLSDEEVQALLAAERESAR
jgi:natural product biosynthesis luciferase-like monooxygenase protein